MVTTGDASVSQTIVACTTTSSPRARHWSRGDSARTHRAATPAAGQTRLTVCPSTTVSRPTYVSAA
jgi:hypothetical protein